MRTSVKPIIPAVSRCREHGPLTLRRPRRSDRRSTRALHGLSRQICQQSQLPGTQYAASRGWDYSGISAVDVTNAGGDVQHFVPWSNTYVTLGYYKCGFAQGFRLAKWSFPKGGTDAGKLEINLAYGQKYDPEGFVNTGFDRLLSVSNSLGREIDFVSSGLALTGFNNHLTGADARSVALGDFTGFGADGIAGSVTDPAAAKTRYAFLPGQARSDSQRPIPHALLTQVYTPDNPAKPNLQYNYDALHIVRSIEVMRHRPWRGWPGRRTRRSRSRLAADSRRSALPSRAFRRWPRCRAWL